MFLEVGWLAGCSPKTSFVPLVEPRCDQNEKYQMDSALKRSVEFIPGTEISDFLRAPTRVTASARGPTQKKDAVCGPTHDPAQRRSQKSFSKFDIKSTVA